MAPGPIERIESFGVVIELHGPSQICRALGRHLPAVRPSTSERCDLTYEIRERTDGAHTLGYEVWRADGTLLTRVREAEVAARNLSKELQFEIASKSADYVFIHAGVVEWNGRAIVLPGRSMSGKTTLVTELLRQGATYYSDEYAVVDHDGGIHPYARPLRIRSIDGQTNSAPPSDFTQRIGTSPIAVGVVGILRFEPAALLDVGTVTSGTAALALVNNTVRAREAPARSIRAASLAGNATSLAGIRGEAEEAAAMLLRIASDNW